MGLFNDVFNAKGAEEVCGVLNKYKSDRQKTDVLYDFLKEWKKEKEIKNFCKNKKIADGKSLKILIKTITEEICEIKKENGILLFKMPDKN